jgi:hypothetical protein
MKIKSRKISKKGEALTSMIPDQVIPILVALLVLGILAGLFFLFKDNLLQVFG